jgi:hypothetical protein
MLCDISNHVTDTHTKLQVQRKLDYGIWDRQSFSSEAETTSETAKNANHCHLSSRNLLH